MNAWVNRERRGARYRYCHIDPLCWRLHSPHHTPPTPVTITGSDPGWFVTSIGRRAKCPACATGRALEVA